MENSSTTVSKKPASTDTLALKSSKPLVGISEGVASLISGPKSMDSDKLLALTETLPAIASIPKVPVGTIDNDVVKSPSKSNATDPSKVPSSRTGMVKSKAEPIAVSYTHLTLPTIYSV